jgi:N-carbamoyl-L-amino-acid hydrolase
MTCSETGRAAGLATTTDAAGNLYVTLKGRDPEQGTFLIASHLDSVPRGGNFDGAAGVIAGIAILTAWKHGGFQPAGDVAVMAIRAEESTWFPYSYIGSKAAFGLLPQAALEIPRADTGRTLAQHMAELGTAAAAVAHISQTSFAAMWSCIEQGPVLVGRDIPIAGDWHSGASATGRPVFSAIWLQAQCRARIVMMLLRPRTS